MNSAADTIKKGSLTKCPSCGAAVAAFASQCGSCGHEFTEIDANRTLRALAERFDEIEREIEQMGLGLSRRAQAISDKKGRVIREFPIPNAREDLQQLIHFIHPKVVDRVKPDPNIEDWRVKFDEVMSRARAAYANDAAVLAGFDKLEQDLAGTMSGELKLKAKRNPVLVMLVLAALVGGVALVVDKQMSKSAALQCETEYSARAATANARLESVQGTVTRALQEKRFSEALAASANLRWDLDAGSCMVQVNQASRQNWEEKRTQLAALAQQGLDGEAAQQRSQAEQQAAVKVAEQNKEAELARIAAERQAALERAAAEKAQAAAAKAATEQRKANTEKLY